MSLEYNKMSQILSRTNREQKFQRGMFLEAKVSGPICSRERKFQGVNWPGSYWPIRSRERIGPGAKRLWIDKNR